MSPPSFKKRSPCTTVRHLVSPSAYHRWFAARSAVVLQCYIQVGEGVGCDPPVVRNPMAIKRLFRAVAFRVNHLYPIPMAKCEISFNPWELSFKSPTTSWQNVRLPSTHGIYPFLEPHPTPTLLPPRPSWPINETSSYYLPPAVQAPLTPPPLSACSTLALLLSYHGG